MRPRLAVTLDAVLQPAPVAEIVVALPEADATPSDSDPREILHVPRG